MYTFSQDFSAILDKVNTALYANDRRLHVKRMGLIYFHTPTVVSFSNRDNGPVKGLRVIKNNKIQPDAFIVNDEDSYSYCVYIILHNYTYKRAINIVDRIHTKYPNEGHLALESFLTGKQEYYIKFYNTNVHKAWSHFTQIL